MTIRRTDRGESDAPGRAARAGVAALVLCLGIGLAWGVVSILEAEYEGGLAGVVFERLEESGVGNPVTAVLLNFRAFDTLLEVGVLVLAVVGVRSLRVGRGTGGVERADLILRALQHVIVPLLVLAAGYLYWAGSHAPGGAFQAGALLGAAGVLLLLSGDPIPMAIRAWPWRLLLVAGLVPFVLVGLGTVAAGREFLAYPPQQAAALILLVEGGLTLTIGIVLAGVFGRGRATAWRSGTGQGAR